MAAGYLHGGLGESIALDRDSGGSPVVNVQGEFHAVRASLDGYLEF